MGKRVEQNKRAESPMRTASPIPKLKSVALRTPTGSREGTPVKAKTQVQKKQVTKPKQKDTVKLSKSDKDLHKKDQKVEQPAETTKQQNVAPAVEKISQQKEISPVPDTQSQPQPEKPEEIQEEKLIVTKDVSIDER